MRGVPEKMDYQSGYEQGIMDSEHATFVEVRQAVAEERQRWEGAIQWECQQRWGLHYMRAFVTFERAYDQQRTPEPEGE